MILKTNYIVFQRMRQSQLFACDELSGIVCADPEVWRSYLLAEPKARVFKNKPLHNYSQLAILFENVSLAKKEKREKNSKFVSSDDKNEGFGISAAPSNRHESGILEISAAPSNHHESGILEVIASPSNHHENEGFEISAHPSNHHENEILEISAAPSNHHESGILEISAAPSNHHESGILEVNAAPCNDNESGILEVKAAPSNDNENEVLKVNAADKENEALEIEVSYTTNGMLKTGNEILKTVNDFQINVETRNNTNITTKSLVRTSSEAQDSQCQTEKVKRTRKSRAKIIRETETTISPHKFNSPTGDIQTITTPFQVPTN